MKRSLASSLRRFLDEATPPVLRDRWPFTSLARIWLGRDSLVDFKSRAFAMSDAEFAACYRAVSGLSTGRGSDTTPGEAQWILAHLGAGRRILEVGPGGGALTESLLGLGVQVTTLRLSVPRESAGPRAVVGVAERLPFSAGAFDVVIAAHVIEHVRSLTAAFLELARVTSDRVLIVVPRQRYARVTFDYHLHFFYSVGHLASHVPSGATWGKTIDGDLCLLWRPAERQQVSGGRSREEPGRG